MRIVVRSAVVLPMVSSNYETIAILTPNLGDSIINLINILIIINDLKMQLALLKKTHEQLLDCFL